MDLRRITLTTRDLALTGLLVSPLWLVLGIVSGDLVMIVAAVMAGMVATQELKPGLVASRLDALAALLPRALRF